MFGRTKKEIQIEATFQDDIWPVEADQGQIDQVLVNLYVNAWQAMTTDLSLRLSTANVILDDAYTGSFKVKPGPFVRITVQDRGKGIDPGIMKRIFEPFFTTKKMGRGTGLGLASAFGIIKNHGGIIDLNSQVDRGTTFYVYLPAVSRVIAKPPPPPPSLHPPHNGSGTLLVVDDEPYILRSLSNILEDMGYTVLCADSGKAAIELFEKASNRIDGVLLDMIMPDLNGRQVLAQLRKIRPDIKVILSSGYSLDGLEETDPVATEDGFIQKPYKIEQLSEVMRAVLRDGPDSDRPREEDA
jgi:CheY-like chemotaxis protein